LKIYTISSSLVRMRPTTVTRSSSPLNSMVSSLHYINSHSDNLTKEQYTGVVKRPSSFLSASRDTLNPRLNTETLKNRLRVIEHFKTINGVELAHWPHFALTRFGKHLYRYKFNYAIKGFAAYLIYRDYARYQ